jgi:phosphate transport system protein
MAERLRTRYQEKLEDLKNGIKKMYDTTLENFTLIQDHFDDTVDLEKTDEELKSMVRTNDLALRSLGDSLESATVHIIGLQAPVARDLRLLLSSFRMIYDLERASRDSYNAFSTIIDIQNASEQFHKETDLMGQSIQNAKEMLDIFITLYQKDGSERSFDYSPIVKQTTELDDKIDHHFEEHSKKVLERAKTGSMDPENALRYLSAIRSIERMGDHCVNLIERTIYVLTGDKIIIG